MKARAKLVLPAPSSPASAITSPGRASAATRAANAAVAASSGSSIIIAMSCIAAARPVATAAWAGRPAGGAPRYPLQSRSATSASIRESTRPGRSGRPLGRGSDGGLRRGDFRLGQAQPRRQAAGDRGAGAGVRVDRHRAAMQFDQALDERQAEPGAGFAGLRVAALEFIENPLLVAGRDAGPGIGDGEDQVTLAASAVVEPRLDPHRAAGRGELDGVRYEVEERLLQPPLVGLDRADLGRTADRQAELLVAGEIGRAHV